MTKVVKAKVYGKRVKTSEHKQDMKAVVNTKE
jgi:hypothetical protein